MIYLYKEDQGYIAISYDETVKAYIMHTKFKRWGISEYKRYLRILQIVKEELKKLTPFVLSLCQGERELKFNKAFGFKETGFLFFSTETGKTYRIARLDL